MKAGQASRSDPQREKAILDFMTELLALDKFEDILEVVVKETPKLIQSRGCSIYLIPPLVKNHKGDLVDDNGEEITAEQVSEDFIILAKASRSRELAPWVGKYFYRAGEGLTGWVFAHQQPLLLEDMTDEEEIKDYHNLSWKNKYQGAQHYYDMRDGSPKPYLAVPLAFGERCYGVIRVGTSRNRKPFPSWAKELFLSFGSVIAHRIELDRAIKKEKASTRQQKKSIENLIKIGSFSTSNELDSYRAILEEAQKIVGASSCCLFLPDQYGETVELRAGTTSDTRESDPSDARPQDTYERGEGLTGWIFATGKPLLINDARSFLRRRKLKNEELERYSDSRFINPCEREICALDRELLLDGEKLTRFAGVPLLTEGNWTQGVLTILSKASEEAFTRHDLKLLLDIAAHISKMRENLEQQKLNEMLIGIGQKHGPALFQYVVENMPALVLARGCSIFLKSKEGDFFQLQYTNSEELKDPQTKMVKPVRYKPGRGKTGLVAQLGRCLVINHYGTGTLDEKKLGEDFQKYSHSKMYRDVNLVGLLSDLNGVVVGLARLVRTSSDEPPFTRREGKIFERFIKKTVFNEDGLASSEANKLCEEGGSGFTKSFLACPLRDRQGNIFGVLRMPRTFPGGTFTDKALDLTASVCNRLSAVLEKEKILEQNLTTLSEINTQINSSFGSHDRNAILRSILEALTYTLGFEFAAIQLVNSSENTIYTEMGIKNENIPGALDPNDWRDEAVHPLDPSNGEPRDIHAWLLREHPKPYVVTGPEPDPHFDLKIFKKYGHDKLIRAFVPIMIQNPTEPIGTFEAGHHIDRRNFIDDKEIEMLKALADQAAIAIRNHRLQEELIQGELQQLVPYMAHILKNPTSQLSMCLGEVRRLLNKATPDLSRLKTYVEISDRLALVAYSMSCTLTEEVELRVGTQRAKMSELVSLIRRQLALLSPPNNPSKYANVQIQLTAKPRRKFIPLTDLECKWIEIILLNLLLNAMKFSPDGGTVHVKCLNDKKNGGIKISVTDQGPGISAEVQEFKPVRSIIAKGWPEGTGLGLHTVKKLVTKMGWTCTAKNNRQRGATFTVHIPKYWRVGL